MNFDHRLNGYEEKKPRACNLSDAINGMTDRANATVTMIQSDFHSERERQFNNEAVFDALRSIALELYDIRNTVDHFYQAQKKPL